MQWDILRRAFHGHTDLILIGDPKQAIYAFRGGDVVAYLAATETANDKATLGRNFRSDRLLLSGLDAVFRQAALGDPRITVRPVDARHTQRRLTGAPVEAPLRLRVATRQHTLTAPHKPPVVTPSRELVAADLAGDVVRLLSSDARLSLDGAEARAVAPGDIAVLVHTNKQAALVRDTLASSGRAGRGHRRRQRLHLRHRGRVAGAAAGARATARCPGPYGRPHLLHGLDGQPAGRGGRPRARRPRPPAARLGRGAGHPGRARAAGADDRRVRSDRAPARHHRRASGSSPTCATSRRRCTRPRSRGSWAPRRWSSGCSTASSTRPATRARSASGDSSPTPTRSRSSPCTAARGWSSPSSTCPTAGTASSRAPPTRCASTSTASAPSTWAASGRRATTSAWSCTVPRRRVRISGCSTSGSPARSARSSPGGPRRPTRRPLPPIGCCSARTSRARCRPTPCRCRATRSPRRGSPSSRRREVPRCRWRPSQSTRLHGGGRAANAQPALAAASFDRSLDTAWRRLSYTALTAGIARGRPRGWGRRGRRHRARGAPARRRGGTRRAAR